MMFYNFFTSFICQQLLHSTPPLFPICPFTFSLLCSSSCISFLVFLSSSPFFWYSSSQPISSPRYLPYPCFFTITTSSSTPSPLPAPPPTSSLITSYKFLPLSFIFSMPSLPPPHYVLPLLLVLIPFLFILLPPCSPLFFPHHLSSFPFSHLSSRSLFLPFFYFHPLLLSQSWSLYLIHQSSKPVMI